MNIQRVLYLSATYLAPIILLFILYALYTAEVHHNVRFYQFAWYALVAVVVLMELRVRLGYRTKRGKLFYLHLIFAVPFFIALTVLAFASRPFWLVTFSNMLLLVLGLAGITLFYRSTRILQ